MYSEKVIILNNKNQKLFCHYYKNTSDTLLIYCHGTESFSKFSVVMSPIFDAYYNLGLSLFWFDFTGYGESEGSGRYNHSQRVEDIGSVLHHFKGKYKKIVLAGISLGSVAATIAAIKYKEVTKLYLVNGYFELKWTYPWFLLPMLLDLLIHTETRRETVYGWKYLKPEKITIPTLFVVGGKDKIVNPRQSWSFYKKVQGEKKLITIPDGDHGLLNPKYIDQYLRQIGSWLIA